VMRVIQSLGFSQLFDGAATPRHQITGINLWDKSLETNWQVLANPIFDLRELHRS
jgi:hypothetical protein